MNDSAVNDDDLGCLIYLITPARIHDLAAFAQHLGDVLDAAPVACVQLRLKDVTDAEIREAADRLLEVCHAREVPLIINDRADIAAEVGADGVHLGQDDGSVEDARKLLGHDADIGVTCHDSRHLAFTAGEAGANYVAFGAFFDSGTKDVEYKAELDLVMDWVEVSEIPCVAIGGITAENCGPIVKAGADFIAVSGAVWAHVDGPVAGVKALHQAIEAASV